VGWGGVGCVEGTDAFGQKTGLPGLQITRRGGVKFHSVKGCEDEEFAMGRTGRIGGLGKDMIGPGCYKSKGRPGKACCTGR